MASICEFAGASLMGAKVTGTISKGKWGGGGGGAGRGVKVQGTKRFFFFLKCLHTGIVDPSLFADNPELFMAGMLSALVGSSVWLMTATWLKLPVSTTHSVVGGILLHFSSSRLPISPFSYLPSGIIGFAMLEKGVGALSWNKIAFVASSWLVSPLLGTNSPLTCLFFILYYFFIFFFIVSFSCCFFFFKFYSCPPPFLFSLP